MKCSPKRLTFWLAALVCALVGGVPSVRAVNLVQEFYLPMPESQLLQAAKACATAITDTNFAIITSILATGNGTIIYYDQWEDGYETNLANPTQPTTQVWGDGNDANGKCPGFAHDPVGVPAGTVITLSNTVPCTPRNPSQILYDGGDHIAATKALVVTRAGWPSPTGPQEGGAAVVVSTLDYGTTFVSPIGQDMVEAVCRYVGFFVMASQDGTVVNIDLDGAGPTPPFTVTLAKGQGYYVNGGVKRGATITASKPVEADLICGDPVNTYTFDWFTLYPQSEWSSSYYTPVPSWFVGGNVETTINYFYNATANPITILYTNSTSSGTLVIPANGGNLYPMPTNSGASFTSAAGEHFTVVTTCAENPTNNPTGTLDHNYNWGFTPLPVGSLTTEADVGWAPGSSDYSTNCSPIWVTPVSGASTVVYVAYRGTNTPLTDPFGGKYSTNYTIAPYHSTAIYVPGTNDQSGTRVYTLDNTLLSVAWGQDPIKAPTGNPALDLGTSVLPFPIPGVIKSASIVTDTPPAGLSVGDTIQYTVQTDNRGLLPLGNTVIIDAPSASLKYVTNSTTLDGVPIPDTTNGFPLSTPGYTIPIILSQGTSVFTYRASVVGAGGVSNTVNIGGTSIIVSNALPPGYGSPSPAVSVFKSLVSPPTGTAGVGQTVEFNLQVIDTGNTILTNLLLVDNYQATNFSFVSASVPVTTTNAGKLTWTNLGSFYPGQSTNISVYFTATNASTAATNSMTASSLFAVTNTSSVVMTIAGPPTPGITVSKTVLSPLNSAAGVGQTVQYNLQVVNSGFTTLTNISLWDNYPSNILSFVTASVLPNTNNVGRLTWTNIGTFLPGQFTNITASFTVSNYIASLTNVMIAYSAGVVTNTNSVVIAISRGALTITKTVLIPTNNATVNIGSNVVFRILIKNTGQIRIGTLPLEDTYAADDFQFVSATIPPSSVGAGDLYWTNLTSGVALATNAVITNDVTMKVTGGATPALNTAFANFAIDTNGAAVAPASGSVGVNTGAGQITGTVYNDINQSGVFTNGDTGIPNVTLTLYTNPNGNGVPGVFVQSVATDVNGNYQLLNLVTGAYVVVESILPGYVGSAPPNNSISINLTTLVTNANNNFFQYQLSVTNYSSIGGTVWNDLTGSGVFHAGDSGILNVEVDLVQDLNSNGVADAGEPLVQNVFTATNGAYSFSGVAPGYYVAHELVLPNYVSTSPTQIGFNIVSGTATNGNDFFDYYVGAPNTNAAPVAVPDFTNTLENVAVLVLACVNDVSSNNLPLTITNVAATNGTAVIVNGTNVLFTPAANFTGTATIGYTETNAYGKSTTLITITVTPVADVGVSKAGPANVFAGTNFNYTLTVTNIGPASASNVVASDVLPTNVVFVSASGGGTTNAGVVSWTLGTMVLHATTNLTLTVKAPVGGTITNAATVSSSTTDTNLVNNTSSPVITLVSALADVGLGKAGPALVFAGTNFSYTISVTNFGPSTAGGILVTDALPMGVVFVSASGGGVSNSGAVTWNVGSLSAGQVSNVTLTVSAPANGSLTNTASVGTPVPDPDPTNNITPPVITTITPVADVAVGESVPAVVVAGAGYTNVITVTNLGPSTASNVVVVAVGSGGVMLSNVVGTLAAGVVTNIEVVEVAPGSGPVTNTASVSSTTGDPNLVNNTNAAVTTITASADVGLGKAGPALVFAGTNFSYTISVTNFGPSTAGGILVTDALPLGAVFVSASGGGVSNSGAVTWNVGSLSAGQVSNVTLTVSAPANGSLTNTASVGTPVPDPDPTNNITPPVITTITPVADVAVGESVPSVVVAGAGYTNVVSVTNLGPSVASNVVVVAVGSGGVMLSNVVGTLAAGVVTNIEVVEVAPGTGPVTNTASVSSTTGDPNLLNNTNAAVTTITASADVGLGKAGPALVFAGTNFSYTISVTNFGPSTAGGILVTDALPLGAVFVSASGGGVSNSGAVTWNVGSLSAGQVSNVTLTVSAPANGSLTNTASVGTPVPDPDPTNNITPPVITTITPVADVAVGESVPAVVVAGAGYTNVITVTNLGPSTASNVVVVAVGSGGVMLSNVVGTLAAGVVTNIEVVEVAPGSGPVTNTASVSSTTGDPNLVNNTNAAVTTITASADVGLGKAGPALVFAGTNFSYTISVTNFGPSTAGGILVTDALPLGAVFVSASGGGVSNSGAVTWNVGSLSAGQVSNVTLTVSAPANGSLTNTASVGTPVPDPDPTNNITPPVITTITPVADVAVGESVPLVVVAGAGYTNVVSVTNLGPSVASNVVVVAVGSGGVMLSNVVGTLAAGVVTNFNVVEVAPGSGPVTNTASVSSTTGDPNLVNNTNAAVTTITASADVGLGKAGPALVFAGTNFSYTISVTNFGPSTAGGILVTDALPLGVVFVSASGGGVSNSGAVTWSVGTLASGQVSNVTLTVSAPANGSLTNVASVGTPVGDPDLTNNVTPPVITVVVSVADVAVGESVPSVVVAGAGYTNVVSVTNLGPSVASNVVVVAVGSGGVMLSNVVGTLAAGVVTNIEVVEVAPGSGPVTNTASVSSTTGDPNLLNNTNAAVSTVTAATPVADVQVFLFISSATNTVGDAFFYTNLVLNAGPSTAVNTLITNQLPTNLVFVSATGDGVFSNGVVTWPVIPTLTNGQATNFVVTVTSVSGAPTIITNASNRFNFILSNSAPTGVFLTNRASAFAATFDPNLTNNTASLSYTNAQAQTLLMPGVLSIFIATNTYPTNGLQGIITNTIIPIGPNLFIVGTSAFNPQTGLYEENVTVTNIGLSAIHAMRLYISGLRSGVTLYNATGTNNGVAYVEYDPPYNSPVNPYPAANSTVTFLLEFFVADRHPFTNSLSAVAILEPVTGPALGAPMSITNSFLDSRSTSGNRFVIEFISVPGRTYTIEYSDDLVAWNIAVPSIVASANVTQWYDDGPPKTLSKPSAVPARYYRVFLDP